MPLTPEQKRAIAITQTEMEMEAEAAANAEPSWSEVGSQALRNSPESAIRMGTDMAKAVASPLETTDALTRVIGGGILNIPGVAAANEWLGADPKEMKKSQDIASAVGSFYKDRYGSVAGFKKALAGDPISVLGDFATLLTGGEAAVGRVPGILGKVARTALDPVGHTAWGVTKLGTMGGGGFNKLITKPVYGSIRDMNLTPEQAALRKVQAMQAEYPNAAADLSKMGPEKTLADVTGRSGPRMARGAANVSPIAQDLISNQLLGREAGQNTRLGEALQKGVDYTTSDGRTLGEMSVDTMTKDIRAQHQPKITAAYTAAKKAGRKLPRVLEQYIENEQIRFRETEVPKGYEDIISTPTGQKAWREAKREAKDLAKKDPLAAGDLAVLDKTREKLASEAEVARRSGDFETANRVGGLAKQMKDNLDKFPLLRKAHDTHIVMAQKLDALKLGHDMAGPRVKSTMPGKAEKLVTAAPRTRKALARGYVMRKLEDLANAGNTEAVVSGLSRQAARAGYEAALPARTAKNFTKAVGEEQLYRGTTKRALGGSNTTEGVADLGRLFSYFRHPGQLVAHLAQFGLDTFQAERLTKMAPEVAKLLMDNKALSPAQKTQFEKITGVLWQGAKKVGRGYRDPRALVTGGIMQHLTNPGGQ